MIVYGYGFFNTLINKLPFELHIPKYQFCGPGTHLSKRLARGDQGINPLDAACKEHDIIYSQNPENLSVRHEADKFLAKRAVERILAKDSNFGEKTAAIGVAGAMKVKQKLGMGLKIMKKKNKMFRNQKKHHHKKNTKKNMKKYRKFSWKKIVNAAKSIATKTGSIKSTLKAAKIAMKDTKGQNHIKLPRVLPIPGNKLGGFLPAFLLPIFAGLSATGALAGGAAGIAKTINDAKAANRQLEESKRHNLKMESIPIGKGLYLKPWGRGLKLHLNSKN